MSSFDDLSDPQCPARQSTDMQNTGNEWLLPYQSNIAQHTRFIERLRARGTCPPMSLTQLLSDREGSDPGSPKSIYCEEEDCGEKYGGDCDEDCDETCSVTNCDGKCNADNNDCEECVRYKKPPCKDKDCAPKDYPVALPNNPGHESCSEGCTGLGEMDCTNARGPICFSPNCDIPSLQQPLCFSPHFSTVGHPNSHYLDGAGPSMFQVNHSYPYFPLGYSFQHDLRFSLSSVEGHYPIEDRPYKRRRADTPVISQTPVPGTPSTTVSTGFEPDIASLSHLASPMPDDQFNYLCHWGESCQMGFMDYCALDDHVLQTHILPQRGYTCQWATCGDTEQDLDQLVDHVKTSHTSNSNQGNSHVCLWQGCNASFPNSDNLSHHLTTVHLQSPAGLFCQWEACGVQADGPDGLTTHLHQEHFVPENFGITSSSTSSPTPAPDQDLVCEWCGEPEGEICGRHFTSPDTLQQHLKDDHIAALKKKTGYYCLWVGCNRRDKQFSQKGKVREIYTYIYIYY